MNRAATRAAPVTGGRAGRARAACYTPIASRGARAGLLPFPPQHLREVPAAVPLPLSRSDQARRAVDRGVHGEPRARRAREAVPRPHDVATRLARRASRPLSA